MKYFHERLSVVLSQFDLNKNSNSNRFSASGGYDCPSGKRPAKAKLDLSLISYKSGNKSHSIGVEETEYFPNIIQNISQDR